jgi:hypothetical protein
MKKKELVKLVMENSEMSFEIEKRMPLKKGIFREKEFNITAIAINAHKAAYRLGLVNDSNYYQGLRDIVENPKKNKKKRNLSLEVIKF